MLLLKHKPTVRGRLWLWGHCSGVHDHYGLPRPSTIGPAEAAESMGIPNLIMVRYDKWPISPYDDLAISLKKMRRVVWSLVGAGGRTSPEERAEVLSLSQRHPNITGFMLDDFWSGGPDGNGGIILPIEELEAIRDSGREIWAVMYISELFRKNEIASHLDYIDHATLWSWVPEHLNDLDRKLGMFRDLVPSKKRHMGVYMWDYGRSQPMPLHIVQRQCSRGLELLRSGELEGMIFLASCICDVGVEAVNWVRDWIKQVADQPCP